MDTLTDKLRSGLRKQYDRISWAYDILDWPYETLRYRHLRPKLVGDLQGEVLEAGVGTGRNLPYYSRDVMLTGIDLSERQLGRAAKRTGKAPCPVKLLQADAAHLPFPDDCFDACVATFLFCVLPDPLQLSALKELLRVAKPGGMIRISEYRYSDMPLRRFFMRLMAPYTEAVFGARFDRNTEAAIAESGALVTRKYFLAGDVMVVFELKK